MGVVILPACMCGIKHEDLGTFCSGNIVPKGRGRPEVGSCSYQAGLDSSVLPVQCKMLDSSAELTQHWVNKMQILLIITYLAMLLLNGCRHNQSNDKESSMPACSDPMIVDEVCSVTQGFMTEGTLVTVRGYLGATKEGSYALYNAQWDPFEPQSAESIPRIALRLRSTDSPDDRVGMYVNITGVIATENAGEGKVMVVLEDAHLVPLKSVGEGTVMKPRIHSPKK